MNNDTDRYSHDLTHLSSREQLSALMDGALPEDQTRFLLRRLQHDVELTESWDSWRLAGEVMRGVTPAQRLPSSFAANVSAALQEDTRVVPAVVHSPARRLPLWIHWSGGAAVAAALALVAVMVRPSADITPSPVSLVQAAPATQLPEKVPVPQQAPAATTLAESTEALAVAAVVAARPVRRAIQRDAAPVSATVHATPQLAKAEVTAVRAVESNDGIVTRPWPRSALPQFDNGTMTVGFGNTQPHTARSNPFIPPVFAAPPKLLNDAPAQPESPELPQ